MTPRERVLAAVNHQEPDRVPIDQGSMRSSGIMAIAYNRLKKHLGVTGGETFVYDLVSGSWTASISMQWTWGGRSIRRRNAGHGSCRTARKRLYRAGFSPRLPTAT